MLISKNPSLGVGGLEVISVISRIHVPIIFLETVYHKNKKTVKKNNYCIFDGFMGRIWENGQIWDKKLKNLNLLVLRVLYTILKEILYRFLFISLNIEDMSPLEGTVYSKILDLP